MMSLKRIPTVSKGRMRFFGQSFDLPNIYCLCRLTQYKQDKKLIVSMMVNIVQTFPLNLLGGSVDHVSLVVQM